MKSLFLLTPAGIIWLSMLVAKLVVPEVIRVVVPTVVKTVTQP